MLSGYKMSQHLIEERADRLTKIATTIGFGEVIKETYHKEATTLLTNTGVIYVVNKKTSYIITVYVATFPEIAAIYNGKAPEYLIKKAKKNEKIYWG